MCLKSFTGFLLAFVQGDSWARVPEDEFFLGPSDEDFVLLVYFHSFNPFDVIMQMKWVSKVNLDESTHRIKI